MFRFACPQWPGLYVFPLGVRFEDGFFETTSADLAERLQHIDGVVLVSEPAALTPVENAPAIESAPVATAAHEPTLAELQAELDRLRAEVEHN